ncbi:MAG TPA: gluconate 2-dehydrogenase subunit 3 family protein [Opitutaceae bacterium]|jgi:hypothetical protein
MSELRMDRRQSIRWMLTAAAAVSVLRRPVWAAAPEADSLRSPGEGSGAGSGSPTDPYALEAGGYGLDPDLLKEYEPGSFWPLTLTEDQRHFCAVLADIVIPADERSPSASSVGVVDFMDEWISAPYRVNRLQRETFLAGIAWMNQEATLRFNQPFVGLTPEQQAQICDDICYQPRASDTLQTGAKFFSMFRDLTAGGFYTTPAGAKDVQYIGNTPMASFPGPPESVLRKLGII